MTILMSVFARRRLTLNHPKCIFNQFQVGCFGHIFSVDHHKVSYMNLLLEIYLGSKHSVGDLGEQSNGNTVSHEQLYTGLQRIHILKALHGLTTCTTGWYEYTDCSTRIICRDLCQLSCELNLMLEIRCLIHIRFEAHPMTCRCRLFQAMDSFVPEILPNISRSMCADCNYK